MAILTPVGTTWLPLPHLTTAVRCTDWINCCAVNTTQRSMKNHLTLACEIGQPGIHHSRPKIHIYVLLYTAYSHHNDITTRTVWPRPSQCWVAEMETSRELQMQRFQGTTWSCGIYVVSWMPIACSHHQLDSREPLALVCKSILCIQDQATPPQLACSSTTSRHCHTAFLSLKLHVYLFFKSNNHSGTVTNIPQGTLRCVTGDGTINWVGSVVETAWWWWVPLQLSHIC